MQVARALIQEAFYWGTILLASSYTFAYLEGGVIPTSRADRIHVVLLVSSISYFCGGFIALVSNLRGRQTE
jgi:hypothetical protein